MYDFDWLLPETNLGARLKPEINRGHGVSSSPWEPTCAPCAPAVARRPRHEMLQQT